MLEDGIALFPELDPSFFGCGENGSKLLDESLYHDFMIVTNENAISVHKMILCNASNVFKAAVVHPLKEARINRYEIKDFDHNIVVNALKFIYSGKIKIEDDAMACQLLLFADKYEIKLLLKKVEMYLIRQLTIDNAIDFERIAEKTKAMRLKTVSNQVIYDYGLQMND